jgi:hypothetical protein
MDLLARLIVDEVHLSPFPSLAHVHQVHRVHSSANLSPSCSIRAVALLSAVSPL